MTIRADAKRILQPSMRNGDDDQDQGGMDTSGEIRRKQLEEAARKAAEERERLRILEAERQRRESERRRRDDD